MSKFKVDLDDVAHKLDKRALKLSEVKDKIEKVAFDVVKFKDGDPTELWQIQSFDDGDYIVAMYDEDKVATASVKSIWDVVVKNAEVHIFYKQAHLCKIAAKTLGLADSDLKLVKQYLPSKLASNETLVKALINSLDYETIKTILSKYPELA